MYKKTEPSNHLYPEIEKGQDDAFNEILKALYQLNLYSC